MTREEAKREVDSITHRNGGLRSSFSAAERKRLDELLPLAFPDETRPTRGVRIGGKEYLPETKTAAHDFYPEPILKVVKESDPAVRMNSARALIAEVRSPSAMSSRHPYWDADSPAHVAWANGLAALSRIASGED